MKPVSTRTLLLMYAAKQEKVNFNVQFVTDALHSEYYCEMKLKDALHHTLAALNELAAQPEFQVRFDKLELLLSPVKYRWSTTLEDKLSVGEFYNAMLSHLLCEIRLSCVKDCEQYRQFLRSKECQSAQ